jgi:hypothetical protein
MSDKEKAAMAIILLLADEENESNKNTRTIDVKNLYKRRQEFVQQLNQLKSLHLYIIYSYLLINKEIYVKKSM